MARFRRSASSDPTLVAGTDVASGDTERDSDAPGESCEVVEWGDSGDSPDSDAAAGDQATSNPVANQSHSNSGAVAGPGGRGKHARSTDDKSAAFSRLASRRVSAVLGRLDQIENLCGGNYAWSQEQQDKIFETIEARTREVKAAFVKAKTPRHKATATKGQLRFTV